MLQKRYSIIAAIPPIKLAANCFNSFRVFGILIFRLVSMDFKKRYLGTLFGSLWALMSPLVTILLIYFVLKYGLKVGGTSGDSFVNWLIPGMLLWLYIQEAISTGVAAVLENVHLVTKVRFPLWVLPLVKVLTPMPVHVLLLSTLMIYLAFTIGASIYWLQILYYVACSLLLCVAIGYITAALVVFVKDVAQAIGVFLQILGWATPVFWKADMLNNTSFSFLLYSPFNYLISGYRESLLGEHFFWENPLALIIFWIITVVLLLVGITIFNMTKKHFADVL